jgi:hypothetical protein
MGKKLRIKKKIQEGYQMGAVYAGGYSGGYNPQGSTVFNNPAPYSYELINLNSSLSQKGNPTPNEIYINRGTLIKGIGLNDEKEYKGRVDNIVKDSDGYIKYVIILDEKTRVLTKINPDKVYILR